MFLGHAEYEIAHVEYEIATGCLKKCTLIQSLSLISQEL